MYLNEIVNLLGADVLTDDADYNLELNSAFSSDVMSDVIAYSHDKSILITALIDATAIRTADLMGITCVIFIGTSTPDQEIIDLANSHGLTIVKSPLSMYVTCGLLFSNGLQGMGQEIN